MSHPFDEKLKNLIKKKKAVEMNNKEVIQAFHQTEDLKYKKWADFIKTTVVPILHIFSQNVESVGWTAELYTKFDTISTYQVLLIMKKGEEMQHLEMLKSPAGWTEIAMQFTHGGNLDEHRTFNISTSDAGMNHMQSMLTETFEKFYL